MDELTPSRCQMNVGRLLSILSRGQLLRIQTEGGRTLFEGKLWQLDSKYIKSCLVTDVYLDSFFIVVVVVD